MKKLKIGFVIIALLFASSFLNSAFANNGNIKKESIIKKSVVIEESKSESLLKAPMALQIIRLYTTCPDGTQQMVGAVGIHTNEYGQVTQINQDYWGEELACRDNQIIHWA